jgi:hypothetical protein
MSEENESSKKRKFSENLEVLPEKKKKVKPLPSNISQEPGTPKV